MAEELIQKSQYSLNGAYPQELPDYWKFSDGTIRTDLRELSDAELEALNWFGPIQMPPIPGTDYFTHRYEWNSETLSFNATELDEFEKRRGVNYQQFWDYLLNSAAYLTIKSTSSQSLEANTIVTEFIALISDAKRGQANVEKIQQSFFQIVAIIPFSPEELAEIEGIFAHTGMSAVYTLTPPTL